MKSKKFIFSSIGLAIIAFIAATVLMMEKIELWKNPNYIPSCSWNPLFSCQGPMNSWQSAALVIPNPMIGMVGFGIVIAILILSLTTTFPKWVWSAYTIGVASAFGYIVWLMTQSLYDIKALCIYCMIVWATLIALVWLTLSNYIQSYYAKTWLRIIPRLTPALIIATYGTFILLIYVQFHDFFNLILGLR